MKEFVLAMVNYHDVQQSNVDNKVVIAVIFLKDHMLGWWTSKNAQ